MNRGHLAVLLGLTVATEIMGRPLIGTGQTSVDPPLVLLFWLAMREDTRRILEVWGALTLVRCVFGIETPLQAGLPALAATGLVRACRRFTNVRDLHFRVLWVMLATALFQVVDLGLRWPTWDGTSAVVVRASLLSALSGLILLPILDALRYLSRPHRFP